MSTCTNPVEKIYAHKTREENVHIADLRQDADQPDLYRARLICEVTHPYFFEHPQDHVPGMLLIEAGRQMVEATSHLFGKVPLQGTTFIWNTLDAAFLHFTDLHMPVDLILTPKQLETRSDGQWNSITAEVHAHQWESPSARLTFGATILSHRAFQRLRWPSGHQTQRRFILRSGTEVLTSLRDASGTEYTPRIHDLSPTGFCLGLPSLSPAVDNGAPFQFTFAFAGPSRGIIMGEAHLRWQDADRQKAGFEILRLPTADQLLLDRCIRTCCFVREDRQ